MEADDQQPSEDLDMVTFKTPATTVNAPAAPNAQEGTDTGDAVGNCTAAGLAGAEGNGRVRVVPFPAAQQLTRVQQRLSRARPAC